jgi:hypothetical protein
VKSRSNRKIFEIHTANLELDIQLKYHFKKGPNEDLFRQQNRDLASKDKRMKEKDILLRKKEYVQRNG